MFCWFFKLTISHSYDVDKPIVGITKKHIDKCAECRQFYNVCRSLKKTLPEEAKMLEQKYPSVSMEKIMQGTSESPAKSLTIRNKFRPIAIAAMIAFLFLLGVVFFPSESNDEKNDNYNKVVTEVVSMISFDRERILSELIEEPLDTELHNIIADAESAAYFLLSCVGANEQDLKRIQ